jgi:tRNA dimethylallyltransferase
MGFGTHDSASEVSAPIDPNEKPLLVVVVGPTAIGKTRTAIQIAQALDTEIINADSRQVYRGMTIGTAQPDSAEREAAPHHFVDFVQPEELYSAGQFESDAMEWLGKWFQSRRTAVLSGGSGLYVKAVLEGLDDIPSDLTIRASLNERLQSVGIEPLVAELRKLDPVHAERMDIQNPQRVVRALEVCLATGRPFSSFHNEGGRERPFDTWIVGLRMPKKVLDERINRRVHQMIHQGLEAEVSSLQHLSDQNALQTVGYREWNGYFDGQKSREAVLEEIQLRTRQFAKRQMTWFQKMPDVHWFNAQEKDANENILNALRVECSRRGWQLKDSPTRD